jgi:peptidoglycan/xylan/chitin deacetylase (PgdA/CDA1 family)
MRLFRPWLLFRAFYPEALFRIKTEKKILYLTFDDGPDPESTPVLLKILGKYQVKALFFCLGEAAEEYPEIIDTIKSEGHIIGNHGYKHFDGWKTSAGEYCDSAEDAAKVTSDVYFRPPYGHLKLNQYRRLRKKYKIIFWDIMPYDFDAGFGAHKSLELLKKKIRNGSVIVLHDTPMSDCADFLNDFIEDSLKKGYRFEAIFRPS